MAGFTGYNIKIVDNSGESKTYENVKQLQVAKADSQTDETVIFYAKAPEGTDSYILSITDTNLHDTENYSKVKIDAGQITNLNANNIKKDVNILGVTGMYEAKGGFIEETKNFNATLPSYSGSFPIIPEEYSEYTTEEFPTVSDNDPSKAYDNIQVTISAYASLNDAFSKGFVRGTENTQIGTAVASDVFYGKTFTSAEAGINIVGTMPDLRNHNITDGTWQFLKPSVTSSHPEQCKMRIPIAERGYVDTTSHIDSGIRNVLNEMTGTTGRSKRTTNVIRVNPTTQDGDNTNSAYYTGRTYGNWYEIIQYGWEYNG